MPVSINNTQIVFNDATTQSTAAVVNTTAVLNATASASVGAVGTYAFLNRINYTAVSPGTTVAGSNLRYAGGVSQISVGAGNATGGDSQGAAPAGTWRAMGNGAAWANCQGSGMFGTLYLRIS